MDNTFPVDQTCLEHIPINYISIFIENACPITKPKIRINAFQHIGKYNFLVYFALFGSSILIQGVQNSVFSISFFSIELPGNIRIEKRIENIS